MFFTVHAHQRLDDQLAFSHLFSLNHDLKIFTDNFYWQFLLTIFTDSKVQ